MKNKISLYVLWTCYMFVYVAAQDECPEPDCSALPPGAHIPDFYNCHRYYICFDEDHISDTSLPCDSGQYFNPITYACEPNLATPCTALCGGSDSVCHMYCDAPGDFVGDGTSCSNYFFCLPGGEKVPHTCPSDHPYFDGKDCMTDSGVCCEEPCAAYCENGNTEIQDPYDCKSYYICLQAGEVDETYHFSCDDGYFFDTTTQRCAVLNEGATCQSVCTDGNVISTTTGNPGIGTCQNTMACSQTGIFARCDYCQNTYFRCNSVGGSASVEECVGNTVFNPVPGNGLCILPENCPFYGN